MGDTIGQDINPLAIPPPSERKWAVKDKYWLVLEMLWLLILIPPYYLLSLFRVMCPTREKSLKGQVVLITGAGRGLGRGLALQCAREGCRVAVVDVNKSTAIDTATDITKQGGIAKAYVANLAKVEDVRELQVAVTKDLGPVDVLVNNAGILYTCPLLDGPEEEIKAVLNVNLASHFWTLRTFLPSMRERNSGHIVAISSVAGLNGVADTTAYSATKFGVRGLMEALRAELQETPNNNIKTTTVFPYFVNTSAHYVDTWDLRLPPISTEHAVKAIMTAIKRDQVTSSVPGFFFTLTNLSRMLPQHLYDKAREIFYTKAILPKKEEIDTSPSRSMAKEIAKQEVGASLKGNSSYDNVTFEVEIRS